MCQQQPLFQSDSESESQSQSNVNLNLTPNIEGQLRSELWRLMDEGIGVINVKQNNTRIFSAHPSSILIMIDLPSDCLMITRIEDTMPHIVKRLLWSQLEDFTRNIETISITLEFGFCNVQNNFTNHTENDLVKLEFDDSWRNALLVGHNLPARITINEEYVGISQTVREIPW